MFVCTKKKRRRLLGQKYRHIKFSAVTNFSYLSHCTVEQDYSEMMAVPRFRGYTSLYSNALGRDLTETLFKI